jgi:hypothetical protein
VGLNPDGAGKPSSIRVNRPDQVAAIYRSPLRWPPPRPRREIESATWSRSVLRPHNPVQRSNCFTTGDRDRRWFGISPWDREPIERRPAQSQDVGRTVVKGVARIGIFPDTISVAVGNAVSEPATIAMKQATEKSPRVLDDNVVLPRLKGDGSLVLSPAAVLREMTNPVLPQRGHLNTPLVPHLKDLAARMHGHNRRDAFLLDAWPRITTGNAKRPDSSGKRSEAAVAQVLPEQVRIGLPRGRRARSAGAPHAVCICGRGARRSGSACSSPFLESCAAHPSPPADLGEAQPRLHRLER